MVAYSFQKRFVEPIVERRKRHTIRGIRRRHARVGEPMQLYSGMRTKHCRKIIDDPFCEGLDDFYLDLRSLAGIAPPRDNAEWLARLDHVPLLVNGKTLDRFQWLDLAEADGFPPEVVNGVHYSSSVMMTKFWLAAHGPHLFEGLIIRWGDRA